MITKATEPPASSTIAIKIGTSGEEPPPLEPGSALLPVSLPAPDEPSSPLSWPPCGPVPEPPPDFEAEPPFPSGDFAPFEPPSVELALPAGDPMPLVDLEPPERFD